MLLTIFLLGAMRVFSQDSTQRLHPKETVFPRVDSLKAAIVTATLRPKMRGDTMEYNTSGIRLRPNANVEELLGRLPGLQVDKDGNIIYNGEKIQHLLVDGEDIFSNNPTLVTRNFDASKIARVQLLDRKSDQTLFTGVDDGTRIKTLNLVLKISAKDGYFGKVELGGNTNGYYNVNAALAAFKNKEQFTALGLAANTGILGLSANAGGTSSAVSFLGITTDPLGASAGNGVPQFFGAALHYSNTWNGVEDHVIGNYQFSHFLTRPLTTIQTVQTEASRVYRQSLQNRSVNYQDQHWGYGVYDWAPAKAGTFKFTFRGTSAEGQNQFVSFGTGSFNAALVNGSQRRIQDKVTQQDFVGEAFWRASIHVPDRNIALGVSISKVNRSGQGYLYSLNTFYEPNRSIQHTDTTDQRKQINGQPISLSGSISYTEPLWKGALLAAFYTISTVADDDIQATYVRGDGKYQERVDSLSSHYHIQATTQRGLLNLQGKSQQFNYIVGGELISYNYWQKDLFTDLSLRRHYINLAPRVILNYAVDPTTNFRFFYTAVTQQPSIGQLQAVRNNNDPLYLSLGNSDLRPVFTQNFHLDVRRLRTWIVTLGLNFSLTNNAISNKTITDSGGRQINQPVNVNGGRTASVNLSINRKVLGFDAGLHVTGNYSRTVNYVNVDLNHNNTYTGGGGFSLARNVPEKYLLQIYTNFSYFDQSSSVNTSVPIRYWTQSHYGDLTFFLIRNYVINTSANYTWQQKATSFSRSTSVVLWNTYISRSFFHDQLVAKVLVNNILDQNSGISRTSVANVNTETFTNILGRYWMLSAIYHFDRKFKKK